ncbi:MAG TPA: hypothetical protein VGQ65_17905 [Thermoanaerobaculia bacterium]|nr:hypothetical protein [Thermoanaerobaculia bacterium]
MRKGQVIFALTNPKPEIFPSDDMRSVYARARWIVDDGAGDARHARRELIEMHAAGGVQLASAVRFKNAVVGGP